MRDNQKSVRSLGTAYVSADNKAEKSGETTTLPTPDDRQFFYIGIEGNQND